MNNMCLRLGLELGFDLELLHVIMHNLLLILYKYM